MAKATGGSRRTGARGRIGATDPLRKTGWQVRQSIAEAIKQAVENGAAESQNAFVERALIRELKELRRQRVFDAYARAAADEAFLADMRFTNAAFDAMVGDGLKPAKG